MVIENKIFHQNIEIVLLKYIPKPIQCITLSTFLFSFLSTVVMLFSFRVLGLKHNRKNSGNKTRLKTSSRHA